MLPAQFVVGKPGPRAEAGASPSAMPTTTGSASSPRSAIVVSSRSFESIASMISSSRWPCMSVQNSVASFPAYSSGISEPPGWPLSSLMNSVMSANTSALFSAAPRRQLDAQNA